uniref:Beta-1,3-galactosyl-O-glycosyl-glycoprotein beta-1,6-N-acetylglucosaminyltransferase 4 n=1 Tax=Magallana gigas TaxID=29159 RepID=K1QDF4_MAGGI
MAIKGHLLKNVNLHKNPKPSSASKSLKSIIRFRYTIHASFVKIGQIIINHRVFYVYTHCPGPQRDTLNCVSGCTGSVTMEGYCKDSSFTEDWADLEGVTRFDINSTSTSVILQLVYTRTYRIKYGKANISTVIAGNYAVALQIEDFTDSSSSVPLSSVPLQFIINVNTGTICSDGVYLVYPTPTAGEKLQAQNGSLQLYARARVNNTRANKDRWNIKEKPPHDIVPVKGSVHVTLNRRFVEYVITNRVAADFLEWVNKTGIPDETFFATLIHNPQLEIPGSFKATNDDEQDFRNRPEKVRMFLCLQESRK